MPSFGKSRFLGAVKSQSPAPFFSENLDPKNTLPDPTESFWRLPNKHNKVIEHAQEK